MQPFSRANPPRNPRLLAASGGLRRAASPKPDRGCLRLLHRDNIQVDPGRGDGCCRGAFPAHSCATRYGRTSD